MPSSEELHPINISLFNEGEWRQDFPFEPYIDGPEYLKTYILKDSTSVKKQFRLKTVNSSSTYSGVTFHINKPVPENATLALRWRGSGHASVLVIDVMDGSNVDSSGTGDSTVVIGETFTLECPAPDNKWNTVSFPLNKLSLSQFQIAEKTLNGVFDYNNVRQVSITICPDSDYTLDVEDLYFYWKVEKWLLASVLLIFSLIGLVLIIRTKPERMLIERGTALNINALTSRVVFSLVGLSAAVSVFLKGQDVLTSSTLSVYAALILLIVIDEFVVFIKPNALWSLRYAVVLFTGYYMGFNGGILPVCLILMASYLPLVLEKIRELFWSVVVIAIAAYIAAPGQDSHFPFLSGLIMIICASASAVILRGYLQEQHKDFIFAQAILQYEALFKKTSDAIYVLNEQGLIVTVNQSFERLTGYEQRELKGLNITSLVCAESQGTIKHMLTTADDNDSRQNDIHFIHKNGQVRTALVRCSPIYKDEQITGFQALATDITERRIAEEKLEATVELLEKKAAELAHLNEQLRFSEEQLKELNINKDKFFSIISHDLKNPFHSLLGFSDLLVTDCDTLEKREIKMFAANINGAVKKLYNLLDNLLQWASIQSGKMKYESCCIKLHKIVESTLGVLATTATAKNIRVINNIEKNILVYADPNSVNSIIQNLVTNAIKFTQAGGKVTISSCKAENMVAIIVRDTGVGMTGEEVKKLFRIDIQHTTKGTAKETGTGLGLILCKEMVERNGGTICVESEHGKGSSFIFTLPEYESWTKEKPVVGTF